MHLITKIFVACAAIVCLSGFPATAQKMYVWCPKERKIDTKPGALAGLKIYLTITDERKFGRRVRNKCTSGELIEDVASVIRQTYPSAEINQAANGNATPEKGTVALQIKIMAYSANFTTAMWHATVEYSVKITDNRKEVPIENSLDIPKERSFFNVNGYSTAKSNLNKTYAEANADLLDFIYTALSAK